MVMFCNKFGPSTDLFGGFSAHFYPASPGDRHQPWMIGDPLVELKGTVSGSRRQ
jgi:hypothetical protein